MIWEDNEQRLEEQLNVWQRAIEEAGMEISLTKSEVMKISRGNKKMKDVSCKGKVIKEVDAFKYLGSKLTRKGNIREEISERIENCSKFYYCVSDIIRNWKIPVKAKIMIYKSYYLPILTYGSECWTWTKKDLSRLQATEMRFLRGVLDKTRRDRIRNDTIRNTLQINTLKETMERNRLKWFGHVKRMGQERLSRRALWNGQNLEEDQLEDHEQDGGTR